MDNNFIKVNGEVLKLNSAQKQVIKKLIKLGRKNKRVILLKHR